MKNNLKETIITICLVLVAVLFLNPFHFWMPDVLIMCMLVVALILFGIFTSFILREKVLDERDATHRALAGRNSFLVGSAILMLAIIIQEYKESLDPWLVVVFIAMIITKIFTRIWSDKNL